MKNIVFCITALITLLLSACNKSILTTGIGDKTAKVVKDCTGTYLQYNGKDYHVCNTEKTASLQHGTEVLTSFYKIGTCTGTASHTTVCMMLHQNEGWIEIQNITVK